jgi:beta-lactamase class D
MRLLCLLAGFFFSFPLFGDSWHAFVLQDVDSKEFLVQEGNLTERLSPYCSFNLALSLIGFDSNILKSTQEPEWAYLDAHKQAYLSWNDTFPEKWAVAHHPMTWMKNSCVWFSQNLAQQFGKKTFADYIAAFKYGNQDLAGDDGKDNGLTHAWIGSSLRISPLEQVHFINQLVSHELPVSLEAHELTREILFLEDLPNGMRLFGKTGAGSHGKGRETIYRVGWFVGWAEKDNHRLAFAYVVHGTDPGDHLTGAFAKNQTIKYLSNLNDL